MKTKYKVALLSIAVLLVCSIMLGTSYSLWTTTVQQEGENVVNVGCFKITFIDTGFENAGTINLSNEYPITDATGQNKQPYKFTIKNECSVAAAYNVNLETLNTSTMNLDYLKVMFNDNNPVIYNNGLESVTPYLTDDASTARKLATGYLADGEEVTYSLRLWIDYSAETTTTNVMGTAYIGKVTIYSQATNAVPESIEYDLDYPISLAEFLDSNDMVDFKGANLNNYVKYNDELWRITSLNYTSSSVTLTKATPLLDYTFDYENITNYSTSPFIKTVDIEGTPTVVNYYDTLNDDAKNMINSQTYRIGQVTNTNDTIENVETQISTTSWSGYVGTVSLVDYILSNSSNSCSYEANLSDIITNKDCINTTFLNTRGNLYLMNEGYIVTTDGIKEKTTETNIAILPTVTLDSHVYVNSGNGTASNPYTLILVD